tara:strand:- start:1193 stop:1354 length:162 start_codon:yes stop_codon:yes gene_type:complete
MNTLTKLCLHKGRRPKVVMSNGKGQAGNQVSVIGFVGFRLGASTTTSPQSINK